MIIYLQIGNDDLLTLQYPAYYTAYYIIIFKYIYWLVSVWFK